MYWSADVLVGLFRHAINSPLQLPLLFTHELFHRTCFGLGPGLPGRRIRPTTRAILAMTENPTRGISFRQLSMVSPMA